jgi:tRNA(fMet)-specific endonuclease VapC
VSKAVGDLALDSNSVIAYFSDNEKVVAWIEAADALFFPVIVVGELEYGALHSSRPKRNLKRLVRFLEEGTILDVTRDTARRYAEIRQALTKQGTPIPEADLWIAAVCRENSLPLLSEDVHFRWVPSLTWHDWTKPIPAS